jgi:putative MATE family efflux protein
MSKTQELGTKSIGSLLLHYSLPAIVAMTASSLYNIVDSMFIGRGVGSMALAGLSVCFPFMNLAAAFGAMIGIGATTVVSVKLGQQDKNGAELALGNVVLLNLIIGVLFAVISLIFLDPILYFFGASDTTIVYAREYMQVLLVGNVITHLYLGLNSVMRAAGYPSKAMYITIVAVVTNIFFNYIFIILMGMGIKGAALGTICAQTLSLIIVLHHFITKKESLTFQKGIFKFIPKIAKQIVSIGLAPFCMNALACVVVMLINTSLLKHGGDMYVGAYGILNRIVFFFVMIVMGFNQGMQPITGYNYGAKQYDRVLKAYSLTLFYAMGLTTLALIICQGFPEIIIKPFTTDEQLLALSEHAIRTVTIFFPLIGFQMVSNNFFQSVGLAKKALFLSTNRQLLFLIPFLLILPEYYGTDGVWWSMPIADGIAAVVALVMVLIEIRKIKNGQISSVL